MLPIGVAIELDECPLSARPLLRRLRLSFNSIVEIRRGFKENACQVDAIPQQKRAWDSDFKRKLAKPQRQSPSALRQGAQYGVLLEKLAEHFSIVDMQTEKRYYFPRKMFHTMGYLFAETYVKHAKKTLEKLTAVI